MERPTRIAASFAIMAAFLLAFCIAGMAGAQTTRNQTTLAPGGSPAIISQYGTGYMVSNITLINPFTLTLNGTKLRMYASYINVNSTGLVVNGSLYALYLDSPVLVKSTPNMNIYSELENVSYYTKNRSVRVYVYSSVRLPGPLLNSTYTLTAGHPISAPLQGADASVNFSTSITTPLSVRIYNLTNTTATPQGYSPLVILGINTSSNSSINVSLSMGYPCSYKPAAVAPLERAANGTWVQIPSTPNIIGCSYSFRIVRHLVIGSVNTNYTVGLFAQAAQSNQSTATTAATTIPSTPASTTMAQKEASGTSAATIIEAIFVIAVVIAILYYLLAGTSKKQQPLAKQN